MAKEADKESSLPEVCPVCGDALKKTVYQNGTSTLLCNKAYPPEGVPPHSTTINIRRAKR